MAAEIPGQLVTAGVPPQFVDQFAGGGGDATKLIVVGQDLGQTILAGVPEAVRPVVEPLIPNIVFGIQQSFSLAISEVFMIGVVMTAVALVAAGFMRELPLRTTFGTQRADAPQEAVSGAGAVVGGAASAGAPARDDVPGQAATRGHGPHPGTPTPMTRPATD